MAVEGNRTVVRPHELREQGERDGMVGGHPTRPRRGSRARSAVKRLRERIRANAVLNTTWRIGVFTVGCTVLLAGVIMLVTPGPGWAGIFVGFAILATEFMWARRALKHARKAAQRARDRALDPRVRRRNQVLAVSCGILVAALVVAYLIYFDGVLPWHLSGRSIPFLGEV